MLFRSVETFFSFEGRDDTTFDNVAAEGIQKYIDRCEPLVGRPYSEYAIPCIPNFTVIPKNKSGVTLDKLMTINDDNVAQLSDAKEDIMRLWIEGVYIGAAIHGRRVPSAFQTLHVLQGRPRCRKQKQSPQSFLW